jgi:hypothetical protein
MEMEENYGHLQDFSDISVLQNDRNKYWPIIKMPFFIHKIKFVASRT